MISMNILIIGASGFVGKSLVLRLVNEKKYKLHLVSRNKQFDFQGAKVLIGDLSDISFCNKIIQGIDIVLYLAAERKNIAHHTEFPFDYTTGNLKPLLTFLEAIKKSKIIKLIYLSSTIVEYANYNSENDGYVLGKFANEIILKGFTKQYPLIDVVIMRSAAVYGPGDNFDSDSATFIPAIIGRIANSKDEIIVWGSGLRKLQFIYIDDLVENLHKAINENVNYTPVIGFQENVSIKHIVEKIMDISDKDLKVVYNPSKPDKITKLVEFRNIVTPSVNLDNGLKRTIEYYMS